MSQQHAVVGAVVLRTSIVFGFVAFQSSVQGRLPRWLDGFRLAMAGLAVVTAAIGLALALNRLGPSETIPWLHGAVIVGLPVMAGSIRFGDSVRMRSGALGVRPAS